MNRFCELDQYINRKNLEIQDNEMNWLSIYLPLLSSNNGNKLHLPEHANVHCLNGNLLCLRYKEWGGGLLSDNT